jgi:hypothetical protein
MVEVAKGQAGQGTREVLAKARSLVESGWHQGSLTDGCGNYCLRAAVSLAAGSFVDQDGAVGYLRYDPSDHVYEAYVADYDAQRVVRQFLPEGYESLVVFNDDLQTTHGDVLAVMDKAIASVAR